MTPTPTDLRLFAIKARLQRATPGPWEASPDSDTHYGDASMVTSKLRSCGVAHGIEEHHDAELIAHAPADLAWLLDLVVSLSRPAAALLAPAALPAAPAASDEAVTLPPDRSVRLSGAPKDGAYTVTNVRAPGNKLVLSLSLRGRYRGVLQPLALQIASADEPIVAALLLDHDNTLRLWAADQLRALALEWEKAGGGA